jgi:hypothetical protein
MNKTLQEYITKVHQEYINDELYDIAILSDSDHGIENVIIWVGTAAKVNTNESLRLKVSNVKSKFNWNNHFDIKYPELIFDPTSVSRWITPEIISKIIQWLELNDQLLMDYQSGKVVLTNIFLSQVKI